jgi:transposase
MVQAGLSVNKAASLTNIPSSTADDLWHKFLETGTTHNRPRSGRPSKVTPRLKRSIIRSALHNRRKPLNDLAQMAPDKIGTTTVRSILAEQGYHRRVARRVPFITQKQKKQRMQWARKYAQFTSRDWRKPIWSDECYVYLGDKAGRIYVTRRPNEENDENCLVPSFKQSSVRVMIWACISCGKKGPLCVLEYPGGKGGGMNTTRYISQVLDPLLKPFFQEMKHQHRSPIFQQDGAPGHRSKATQKWFSDHSIPLMDHPPNSPDVSPIEPVWHELKKRLRARSHPPTSVSELIAAVKEAWDEIDIATIDKYILTMPYRVQAVLDSKGGHTRF